MASVEIALRFRDTTDRVDTIAAHMDIIDKSGSVYWGWWKKGFEDDKKELLSKLTAGSTILLLDRSTKRMFRAITCSPVIGDLSTPQLARVPEYYRNESRAVFAWFEFKSIEQLSYDEALANKFGDNTIVERGGVAAAQHVLVKIKSKARGNLVVHLSDLHFGADHDFEVSDTPKLGSKKLSLSECIIRDLKRLGLEQLISAVLITGDFITAGDWNDNTRTIAVEQLNRLREGLSLEKDRLILVPGNHDIERYPESSKIDPAELSVQNQTSYKHEREYRTFHDEITGLGWQHPLQYCACVPLGDTDLMLCVLNSCTILATEWTEYGYVGERGLDAIGTMKKLPLSRPTFKAMALHHHLLPVSHIAAPNKKGVTLSLDAPHILDAAQAAGIQLALHGHEHQPRIVKYSNIPLANVATGESLADLIILSNGSTGASERRRPSGERNTYCILDFSTSGASVRLRELRTDGTAGADLFNNTLGIMPL